MMKKMCGVHKVAWVLVLVGALNWGLVGLVKVNLVTTVLGSVSWLERLVYVLVGLSAVMVCTVQKCCMKCGGCGEGGCGSGSCGSMKPEEKKM